MTTPRVTVPVEDLAGKLKAIRDKFLMPTPDKDFTDYAIMTRCVEALSAAPVPEVGAVDWSYDLTSCPSSEPFLIAYADGDVRMGHYLDNSKSSVPWEGIRPLFGAERWDAKIVAWAKRPALATRETAPAEAGEQWLWRIPGRGWVLCDKEGDVVREVSIDGAWIETEVVALSALRAQPQAREDAQPVAWRLLAQQQPQPGHKIFTLHDDGSGARLLFVYDGGVIDSDGDDYTKIGSPQTWWAYLPDGFEFSCEGISEDPVTLPAHRIPNHPAPDVLLEAVAAALKPFAMAFRGLSSRWGDHETHWQGATSPIAVEDLRRADEALAALQAEQKGGA